MAFAQPSTALPWEEYPSRETARASHLDDMEYFRDRLEKDSERLFSVEVNVDILCCRAIDCGGVQSEFLKDVLSLDRFLDKIPLDNTETVVVLNQQNTYGAIQITPFLFKRLMTLHQVFPPFLNYIHGFGYRRWASDDMFNSYNCRYSFSSDGSNGDISYEFCYNIHYAARNGRDTGSPWSLRHTAIYEQYDSALGLPRWIIVQPPDGFRGRIVGYLGSDDSKVKTNTILGGRRSDSLILHSMLFESTGRDWRDYINDLVQELKTLEEKVLFSRVGRSHDAGPGAGLSVTFSDLQALRRMKKKMLKVQAILDSTLEVAAGYEKHCLKLRDCGCYRADHFVFVQIDIFMTQLRNHKGSMSALLDQSDGVSQLLFQILQYKNEETMLATNKLIHASTDSTQKTNELIRRNGEELGRLTISSCTETKAIARLTEDSHKDARSVKVLTFIAMLYLPASLVATIFSSNLVSTEEGKHQYFSISPLFWLFPVFAVALALLTIIITLVWEHCLVKIWQKNPIHRNHL